MNLMGFTHVKLRKTALCGGLAIALLLIGCGLANNATRHEAGAAAISPLTRAAADAPPQDTRQKLTTDQAAALASRQAGGGFPDSGKSISAVIHGGGPAPGIEIPGLLSTEAVPDGNGSYTVTLTASWKYDDFHAGTATETPRKTLSHFWIYKVDASGAVVSAGEGGDFSPGQVK